MPIMANGDWVEDIIPLVDGLFTVAPAEVTPKGAATDIDWFYEVDNGLRKIPGRMSRGVPGTANEAVRGMFFWHRKTDSNLMVVHTEDKMFTTSDFITFTQRATGLTGTKRDFISYAAVNPNDVLLMTDGVDVPKETTGTTYTSLTLPGSVTNARFVFHFKNRTILLKTLEAGVWQNVRFHWSVEGSYNVWTAASGAGSQDITDGGGTVVMAVLWGDMVVVFKRHCINTISWTGDEAVPWRVAYYPELPGTIYPGSVQVSASGVIYLAQDGLRLFSGNSSTPVAPNVMLEITAIAADQANAVTSTFDQRLRRYMLGVPTAGQTDNNRVWELHLDPEQVKLFKRSQQVSAFGFFYRVSPLTFATLPVSFQQAPFSFDDPLVLGSYPVLVSGDYDGEVYEHEVTTDDDGETVESFVELGPFPKDPNITMLVDKRLIEMRLRGYKTANTTLTIKIRPIHSTVWTTLTDSPDMSTHEDSDSHIIPVDISGEQFFIRLENDQQYGWPQFYYIGLFGTSTGRPRRR